MTGWTTHTGMAAGLPEESIDTDQLIPARFMSAPRNEGYGKFLLHDIRFAPDGTERDTPLRADTSIIVTRRNFGSGSSREAAVYALVDYGVRAVIAPSFGDIFASNAVNNGLLPARVDEDVVESLLEKLGDGPQEATVNLQGRTCGLGGMDCAFALPDQWQQKLVNGWDDIDLTRQHLETISAFSEQYSADRPWAAHPQD